MIRGKRMRFHIIGGGGSLAPALLIIGLAVFVICMSVCLARQTTVGVEAAPADQDQAGTYLGQARKFLDSGTHNQQAATSQSLKLQQSNTNSLRAAPLSSASSGNPLGLLSSSSDRDPQLEQQLRQSIKVATDMINNYRQNGLSSLPSLPNLPGVGTVMRLPDKLLRAELSMIQDEIRMAMEMMNNPLAATMNAPRDIASMFYRMAEQLEQ